MLGSCRLRRLVQGGCSHLPSLLQVTRQSPTPLSTWGSSRLAWRLPCCMGASAGWQQAGILLSLLPPRGLPTLLGMWGFFWESQADLCKLGVSPGPGGSVSRRQPAKPCRESAWPINI